MTVLVALRHRPRAASEIVGVVTTDSSEALDRLASECESRAYADYVAVRRVYGDAPPLEEFVREFVRWKEGDRSGGPTVLYANVGEWHYCIERREPLC